MPDPSGTEPGRAWLALFAPGTAYFRPFQLVTSMFMHSDFGHILFNMFGLLVFGPRVEMKLGAKKFLILFLIAGFGATGLQVLAHFIESDPAYYLWGASGCVMGISAAYATLFPNSELHLILPPITLKAWQAVLAYIVIDIWGALGFIDGNIAHFAHLGGAIFGFLFIRYFGKDDFRIN